MFKRLAGGVVHIFIGIALWLKVLSPIPICILCDILLQYTIEYIRWCDISAFLALSQFCKG